MSESRTQSASEEFDHRCQTAGALNNDLVINTNIVRCGQITDGVAFRSGRGGWVLAFADLKAAYELACKRRGLASSETKAIYTKEDAEKMCELAVAAYKHSLALPKKCDKCGTTWTAPVEACPQCPSAPAQGEAKAPTEEQERAAREFSARADTAKGRTMTLHQTQVRLLADFVRLALWNMRVGTRSQYEESMKNHPPLIPTFLPPEPTFKRRSEAEIAEQAINLFLENLHKHVALTPEEAKVNTLRDFREAEQFAPSSTTESKGG